MSTTPNLRRPVVRPSTLRALTSDEIESWLTDERARIEAAAGRIAPPAAARADQVHQDRAELGHILTVLDHELLLAEGDGDAVQIERLLWLDTQARRLALLVTPPPPLLAAA